MLQHVISHESRSIIIKLRNKWHSTLCKTLCHYSNEPTCLLCIVICYSILLLIHAPPTTYITLSRPLAKCCCVRRKIIPTVLETKFLDSSLTDDVYCLIDGVICWVGKIPGKNKQKRIKGKLLKTGRFCHIVVFFLFYVASEIYEATFFYK